MNLKIGDRVKSRNNILKRLDLIESMLGEMSYLDLKKQVVAAECVLKEIDDKSRELDHLRFILFKMIKNQDCTNVVKYIESGMTISSCVDCGFESKTPGDIHWHHVVPKSKGGKFVVPLCEACHSLVHHDNPEKFMHSSRLIREGIEKARLRGQVIGRPIKLTPEKIEEVKKHIDQGTSIRVTAKLVGLSKTSVVRIKRSCFDLNKVKEAR